MDRTALISTYIHIYIWKYMLIFFEDFYYYIITVTSIEMYLKHVN